MIREICKDCGQMLPVPPKPSVRTPDGFEVSEGPHGLEIVWEWRSLGHLVGTGVAAAAWIGFLIAIFMKIGGGEGAMLQLLAPMSLHMVIGACLAYRFAAVALNSTRVRVVADSIVVRHGPLPWFGNKVVSRGSVEQCFVEHRLSRRKRRSRSYYDVVAVLKGTGDRVRLIKGFDDPNKARFIEQELERWMGIQDAPVAGEHK